MRAPLALLVITVLCPLAGAEPQAASPREMSAAARPYYERGAARYEAGDYTEAIEAFEHGRRLDPHPDFLYAEAQAYRKAGDCARAISLYQSFLATHPPDEEAERARANLERCPLRPAPAAAQPPLPPAPPADAPWYTDVTGDVLAATGVIAVSVGATYLVMGDHDIRDANNAAASSDATLAQVQRLASSGSRERQIGGWTIAGGGALLVGAIARYALHRRSGSATGTALRVLPAPGGASVSWGGKF